MEGGGGSTVANSPKHKLISLSFAVHIFRVAVVTGGNKGIGLEVCRQLADNGITVVLTARDEARGTAAVGSLGRLPGDVIFHQLDVTADSSAQRLADFVSTRFGKLDILVNNAAIGGVESLPPDASAPGDDKFKGMDAQQRLEWMRDNCRETYEDAKQGLETNYYGTKRVTEALLSLLLKSSSPGRIVNVSSGFGLLRLFGSEELRRELDDIENLTEARLDELLATFMKDMEAGGVAKAEACGWPAGGFTAYKVGKAAVNAYSRILARRHAPTSLLVNCAHPGYVKTDMTSHSGILTPEEGARNVVAVVMLRDGGPTGAYFHAGPQAPFV